MTFPPLQSQSTLPTPPTAPPPPPSAPSPPPSEPPNYVEKKTSQSSIVHKSTNLSESNESRLTKQKQEYEGIITTKDEELRKKTDQIKLLHQDSKRLEEEVGKLHQNQSLKEQEISNLNEKIRKLNQDQSSKEQEIRDLNEKIRKLNQDQSSKDQNIRNLNEEIRNMNINKLELKNENSTLREQTKSFNEIKSSNEQIMKELKEEINNLHQNQASKDQEIKKLNEEISKLNQNQTSKDQEIKKLNDEIKKLRNQPASKNVANQPHGIEILDEDTINNLEKIEKLGNGGGGKVYKVFKKVVYALKVMKISEENHQNLKNFLNEYGIMNMMNHPNILKTFGIFMSSENNPPSILLEYCPKNLDSVIKKKELTNVEIVFSIYQIAEGMKYVHFKNVIHRDLKPTNILISEDGTIKICDFGISKLMTSEEQTMTRGVGSQKFMAPEIINEDVNYDEKVDVYSFGVLVYFMLNRGEMPVIKIGEIFAGKKAEIPSTCAQLAKEMINSCWEFDPKERPSFKSICEKIEKNDYKLIDMTQMELNDLKAKIGQHKSKIPKYDE